MANKTIEFKGTLARVIWHNDDFWILGIYIDPDKYPDMKIDDRFGTITLLGDNLFEFDKDVEYTIRAREEIGKRGTQYRYIACSRDVPITEIDTLNFLKTVLTGNQAKEIMRSYPNIINLIKDGKESEIDTNKLKGIGPASLKKIIKKIRDNFTYLDICSEFYDLISLNMIVKLYDKYGSVRKIKEKLKQDPYSTFFALDRVGFRKADEIILKMEDIVKTKKENGEEIKFDFGKSFRESQERCHGAVNYYLAKNEEEEGATKMTLENLDKLVRAYCPEARRHIKNVVFNEIEYYIDKQEKTISFMSTFLLESYIASTLIEANKNPIKWEFECEKYKENEGFVMTDEQMSVFENVCKNNFSVLTGNGGCVDCDTEFFNGKEWKKISEWTENDKVLQYNEDGTAELVTPEEYHKYECNELWEVKDWGVDMCLSDEHNVVYSAKNKIETISFKELREYHDSNKRGFMGKFMNKFVVNNEGISLLDDEIKLYCLLAIKGERIKPDTDGSNVKIVIEKSHQMVALRDILNANKIKWRENRVSIPDENKYCIEVFLECNSLKREYPSDWYNMSQEQLKIFADSILDFEGKYYENARFIRTENKNNADFIQFAFINQGFSARITELEKEDGSKEYEIRIGIGIITTIEMIERLKEKGTITKYIPIDGFKYCFTVPSHMWVMRRNGIVVITGNSGKTQTVKGVVDMLIDNNITFAMAAPTARASKVIEKYTGIRASTIHRLLGFGIEGMGPTYNSENKLPYEMIIIDEVSMLDDKLCKYLLDAIDFKRTKMLFVGDPAQLSPVGIGNILHDIIDSGKFPITNLTKIFRYNEGGLIKVTTDIRNCKKYLNENMEGQRQNFGNGYIFCPKSKENCLDYSIQIYENFIKKYGFDNVLMLSAQNVGNFGTKKINSMIQNAINKNEEKIKVNQDGEEVVYKLNDVVIMKKNTYDSIICDETGYYEEDDAGEPFNTTLVANGETGVITKIGKLGVVIKYDENYIWTPKKILEERIRLGYCISIHSSQGSQCDNVVVITPEAHSYMTNSNLLYVATSRCKKRCIHIGNMRTINNSIKKKQEITRGTNMKKIFIKLAEEE